MGVLATAQGGVVSLAQALALGASAKGVRVRRERGRWIDLHRGVYAVGHVALTARGRAIGALLAARGSVLSHVTAAAVWGFRDDDLLHPHVTERTRSTRVRGTLTIHGTRDLPGTEIRMGQGLPLTSPERTLIDMAEVATRAETARAIREARVAGLVTDDSLEAALARHPARHGAATLRLLLQSPTSEPSRSTTERELGRLIAAAGLPKPGRNVFKDGYECDFVWEEQRVMVETDAYSTHGDRATFERDRARDAHFAAKGWSVVRFTRDQIRAEPLKVLATLAGLLAR